MDRYSGGCSPKIKRHLRVYRLKRSTNSHEALFVRIHGSFSLKKGRLRKTTSNISSYRTGLIWILIRLRFPLPSRVPHGYNGRPMLRSRVGILSWALFVFFLAVSSQSQARRFTAGLSPQALPSAQDLSTWQTVSLAEKGIVFKLPPDWRHLNFDMEAKEDTFTIQEIEWNTPHKDLDNRDRIRVFTRTFHNGFAWFGHPASREEMLDNKFDRVTRSAQSKQPDISYSEVRKINLGGVAGVFRVMRNTPRTTNKSSRVEIMWTGYRMFHGKAQETDLTLSSTLKGEALLRTIFGTLDVAQDKDGPKN